MHTNRSALLVNILFSTAQQDAQSTPYQVACNQWVGLIERVSYDTSCCYMTNHEDHSF
jgi:hypothetical protein